EVQGTKNWNDGNQTTGRPGSITVNLLAEGVFVKSLEVSSETEWQYTFEDLDKYNTEGQEIKYSIEEDVAGYSVEYDGFTIKNTKTINVSGNKTWSEIDPEKRPDAIRVHLKANGEHDMEKEVSAATDWAYTFENLNQYDSEGKEIIYTVEEEMLAGYDVEITGYDIHNIQREIKVSGQKIWKDNHSPSRPDSILVDLLADGQQIKTQEVTGESDW